MAVRRLHQEAGNVSKLLHRCAFMLVRVEKSKMGPSLMLFWCVKSPTEPEGCLFC